LACPTTRLAHRTRSHLRNRCEPADGPSMTLSNGGPRPFLDVIEGPPFLGVRLGRMPANMRPACLKPAGSSGRRPTLGLKQIRFAPGEIAQSRVYIHCDEPASTRKPISTGLGEDLRTQKSFIQRLRCRFACAISVRRRLRSRPTGSRRHLQRHESENARAETRRLGLAFEIFVLRSRAQGVETGFCVRRGRSQCM